MPAKTPSKKNSEKEYGDPKFPYTTEPQALGRLLTEIPKRPKPQKITMDTLRAWNVSKNNNARTAISVLKKLGLLGSGGEPNESYTEFMKKGMGAIELGRKIRDCYKILFENSHAPQSESQDDLKNLFHIHSGGGEDAMRLQIQTFKTLTAHANFTDSDSVQSTAPETFGGNDALVAAGKVVLPPIQVDLHIHLPENKSTRDYESIIQDIARYIYGRNIDGV